MAYASGLYAIAVCDRCRLKKRYVDLQPDGNSPGLRVCRDGCYDEIDPYRLPAIQPDAITLQYARSDASLATSTPALTPEPGDQWIWITTENGNPIAL